MYFARYFMGVTTDLIVLNLIAQYWDRVHLSGFTVSLFAAVLLQLLLQATLTLEHSVGSWFEQRSGALWKTLRFFSAWVILFGSKFVMLGAISYFMGDSVHFEGPLHGAGPFIWTVVAMLLAEELVTRAHRSLS